METKVCSGCEKRKQLTLFNKSSRRADGRQSYCRKCQSAHYDSNKESHLRRVRLNNLRYKQERDTLIRKAKDRPCADCGKKYPHYVMDFDHLNPAEKIACVAHLARRKMNLEKLRTEILKCEVVCSNCHRERTFGTAETLP